MRGASCFFGAVGGGGVLWAAAPASRLRNDGRVRGRGVLLCGRAFRLKSKIATTRGFVGGAGGNALGVGLRGGGSAGVGGGRFGLDDDVLPLYFGVKDFGEQGPIVNLHENWDI